MGPVSNARRDPTRTATLRQRYVGEVRRHFAALKALVVRTVEGNDALGLGERPLGVMQARPATRYDFPSDPAGKAQAFMDWLYDAADREILEVTERDGRKIVSHGDWQNVYVRSAYGSGVDQASAAARRAGIEVPEYSLSAVFNRPIHADLLAMLYTRNYNELRGITEAMGQQIARTLAEGMGQGVGPREMARMINDRVDAVGVYRATVMARTEVIHAHAEATLNRYQEFGIEGVTAEIEFSTSGDDRVCDICAGLEGKVYTLAEARGVIPVHPQCRCTWLPVAGKK